MSAAKHKNTHNREIKKSSWQPLFHFQLGNFRNKVEGKGVGSTHLDSKLYKSDIVNVKAFFQIQLSWKRIWTSFFYKILKRVWIHLDALWVRRVCEVWMCVTMHSKCLWVVNMPCKLLIVKSNHHLFLSRHTASSLPFCNARLYICMCCILYQYEQIHCIFGWVSFWECWRWHTNDALYWGFSHAC